MEALEATIELRAAEKIKIYLLGDIHAGCKQCAEDEIHKMVAKIKAEPRSYFVGMGDYSDCITPFDKRWDIGVVSDWVKKDDIAESQRQWVSQLFDPIKKKCLAFLMGNHEDSIRRFNQHNIYQHLLDDLGLPFAGYSTFLRLHLNQVNSNSRHGWTGAFTHGAGSARTPGGRLNRLLYFMTQFDADFYGYGHTHDILTYPTQFLMLDQGLKIKHKVKAGALSGSWVKGYMQGAPPSYVERAVYPPTRLGCAVFEIKPYDCSLKVYEEDAT